MDNTPIEGLKFDSKNKPERLILDGQQRLTSLYRALMHQEPVQTQDIRKKPVSGWFYIDIEAALKDGKAVEADGNIDAITAARINHFNH
jgi:hypothetical protein